MRSAVAGLVLGLALAVGVPATWVLTRPPATAGQPVSAALDGPSATPAPSAAEGPSPTPSAAARADVPRRDAAPTATDQPAPPVRLRMPGVGVDAPVDEVGLGPDGQMALPENVRRVGWYRFGPAPGAPGSAVVAGHVDDRAQGLGVLAALRQADVGEQVVVADATGAESRWRVVSREVITKQQLPLAELFRRDGAPRLTLVTCGGPFLPDLRSYRDNVVVVAIPEM